MATKKKTTTKKLDLDFYDYEYFTDNQTLYRMYGKTIEQLGYKKGKLTWIKVLDTPALQCIDKDNISYTCKRLHLNLGLIYTLK